MDPNTGESRNLSRWGRGCSPVTGQTNSRPVTSCPGPTELTPASLPTPFLCKGGKTVGTGGDARGREKRGAWDINTGKEKMERWLGVEGRGDVFPYIFELEGTTYYVLSPPYFWLCMKK